MPRHSSTHASPFLKWAGGKTQLLPALTALYPRPGSFKRYVEPFVGSGAVFFHVQRVLQPKRTLLTDTNADLIATYEAVRDDLGALIEALRQHTEKHCEEHFYAVRASNPRKPLERAARLIYLNKTCFNGLYRVNSRGEFNVPIGRYKNPRILDEGLLRRASESLQGVELRVADFRETLAEAGAGDFVYLDPPYDPLSPTASFTAYNGTFGESEQRELAGAYATLAKRGCYLLLSNSATPLIQKLYQKFRPQPVSARRSINSNSSRRGPIDELVVVYSPKRRRSRGQAEPHLHEGR